MLTEVLHHVSLVVHARWPPAGTADLTLRTLVVHCVCAGYTDLYAARFHKYRMAQQHAAASLNRM